MRINKLSNEKLKDTVDKKGSKNKIKDSYNKLFPEFNLKKDVINKKDIFKKIKNKK